VWENAIGNFLYHHIQGIGDIECYKISIEISVESIAFYCNIEVARNVYKSYRTWSSGVGIINDMYPLVNIIEKNILTADIDLTGGLYSFGSIAFDVGPYFGHCSVNGLVVSVGHIIGTLILDTGCKSERKQHYDQQGYFGKGSQFHVKWFEKADSRTLQSVAPLASG
jgi:hypothetical protein